MASSVKNTKVRLDRLTDIDMLLMVKKGIRKRICHAVYRYEKANNKYIKDYDKTKELSYLTYWGVNIFYGWAMSQKLSVNGFKLVKNTYQFNEDFIKGCNKERDEGYLLEVDVQYPEKLHDLYNDLPFLLERMKIQKVEKLVANLLNKNKYVIHIKNSKQASNLGLVLKKSA